MTVDLLEEVDLVIQCRGCNSTFVIAGVAEQHSVPSREFLDRMSNGTTNICCPACCAVMIRFDDPGLGIFRTYRKLLEGAAELANADEDGEDRVGAKIRLRLRTDS